MAITSYAQLVSAVKAVIEDDSDEVSAYLPTAINLAEDRVASDMDMKALTSTVNVSAIGSDGVTVSTGIDNTRFLYFTDVFHSNTKLDNVNYSFVKEFNRYETSIKSSARYYAFNDTVSAIYLCPKVSSAAANFEINYIHKPAKLTSNVTSNIILQKAPNVLFYRTLVEMQLFAKNWETMEIWNNQYQTALETALNISRKERKDTGQAHNRPQGSQQSTTGIN